jgi:putative ABC transport system ATP-binding protein
MTRALKVRHISKIVASGTGNQVILDNITFNVDVGEIVLIMGHSGSGKTSLLTLLGALQSPTSGTVEVAGESLAKISPKALPRFRLMHIGFIFQQFNLLSSLTTEQNILVPLLAAGMPGVKARRRVGKLLHDLHLSHRASFLPRNLSGGEQQRVAIARALANEPKLLLADEPTANLDTETGQRVLRQILKSAEQQRSAVVITSHDARIQELVDRVIVMQDGRITRIHRGGRRRASVYDVTESPSKAPNQRVLTSLIPKFALLVQRLLTNQTHHTVTFSRRHVLLGLGVGALIDSFMSRRKSS